MNRNEAEVGSSVLKVLFSHLFTKAPSLFMKTWPQVARIKAFQWSCLLLSSFFSNPFSFSLRSIPGACLVSKGLMRLWILRWMLKNERNISLSFSVSQKILNTRGSIQGMIECLRGSNMFTVGKQRSVWTVSTVIYSANTSFPLSSQQKEPDTGGPASRLQHHFGTSLLHRMLLSNSHNSVGPHSFPRSYVCLFTIAFRFNIHL